MPIFLIFLTSAVTGSKIRTMWMTPFYLFFGVLFIYIFQSQINLKKVKSFLYGFLFLFFLSPILYTLDSVSNKEKRTDYPGKEIAAKVQITWDQNFDQILIRFWSQLGVGIVINYGSDFGPTLGSEF